LETSEPPITDRSKPTFRFGIIRLAAASRSSDLDFDRPCGNQGENTLVVKRPSPPGTFTHPLRYRTQDGEGETFELSSPSAG
jgi:hypothetical protein